MTKQEKLREYLAGKGYTILKESYSLDAGKYYVCFLVVYTGKCREISELEAIVGSPESEYINREMRLCYLASKLKSTERAYEGKRQAGLATEEDYQLLCELKKYIDKV